MGIQRLQGAVNAGHGRTCLIRISELHRENVCEISEIVPSSGLLVGIFEAKSVENGFGAALRSVLGNGHTSSLPRSTVDCRTGRLRSLWRRTRMGV